MVRFWSARLGVGHDRIRLQRWFRSRPLPPRVRHAEYGVMTVRSSNADLRIRLHGWIQRIREEGFPERAQEELFELAS
jgi:hypothetical protein